MIRNIFLAINMAAVAAVLCGTAGRAAAVNVDPRGPIQVAGLHPEVVPGGVQASGYSFRPVPVPPWTASWVWLPPAPDEHATVACFRKEFTLAAAPSSASAWVSADWHYRLYVNGHLISRGPADPGADYPGGKSPGATGLYFADHCDLAPFLTQGRNVIAAEVFPERLSEWYGSSGHPGFFFQTEIPQPGAAPVTIQSDATWRARGEDYWRQGNPLTYLAAKEPAGWRDVGFDDAGWQPAAPIESHWPHLLSSELPPPMEVSYPAVGAIRVSPGIQISDPPFQDGRGIAIRSNGSFTLRYDHVLAGFVGLHVRGGAGATLRIEMNESNSPGGRRSMDAALSDGDQYVETPFYGSFTFLNVVVSGVKAPFEILDIRAIFTSRPVSYKGSFTCSNEALNTLWTACRWGTQLGMQDHWLDSPDHQEPICDPGDYLIESLVNYQAFDEPWLTRQDLRKFGALLAHNDYINFHTSYSLLWLQMLLDYYDYTGDGALVRELSPQVFGLLDKFNSWRGKNGLISEAPDYMFMDWVSIDGIACHHPPAVIGQGYMTAFYYRGLADARRVAEMMGDTRRVQSYDHLRSEVLAAFNRELWDPGKGLYRDGKPFQTSVKPGPWLPADTNIETFSPHVNSLAVLYDLAPRDLQPSIMQKVMAPRQINCQPYFMHFVLCALDHVGLFDTYAPAQLARWHVVPQTGTIHEMWDSGDLSHGWGGTPLYQLSSCVLGITPAEPNFGRVSIRPHLLNLTFARGAVPTAHGPVLVSWKLSDGRLNLDVTTPVPASLTLPAGRFSGARVTVNGQSLSGAAASNALVTIPAGTYHFQVTGKLAPALVDPSAAILSPGSGGPPVVHKSKSVPPIEAWMSGESGAAFEKDVSKDDLVNLGPKSAVAGVDEHVTHEGGGANADAIRNGTTLNGAGGTETADDGQTFRGYGDGDHLTLTLDVKKSPAGYDITRIVTLAGHPDSRASQYYSVSISFARAPEEFVKLIDSASVQSSGGSSKLVIANVGGGPLANEKGVKAAGVAAIRFDFKSGSADGGPGDGFDVYREIDVIGSPAKD